MVVADLEIGAVVVSCLFGIRDGVVDLIRIDVEARHEATGEGRHVISYPATTTADIKQTTGGGGLLQLKRGQDHILPEQLVLIQALFGIYLRWDIHLFDIGDCENFMHYSVVGTDVLGLHLLIPLAEIRASLEELVCFDTFIDVFLRKTKQALNAVHGRFDLIPAW